jgi:S1-C subfamily serine protease
VLATLVLLLGATFGYALGRNNNSGGSSATQSPFGNQAPFGNGQSQSPFGNGQSPFGNGTGNGNGSTGNGSTGNGSSASSGAVASVANKVNPGIVNITSSLGNGEAKGTGMVITSDGLVLTNNHVIDGATSIRAELVATGQTYDAKLLGYAVSEDVALLKIEGVSNLQTVDTSTSDVSVNDDIVVIGNAGGQDGTPTVVSGTVTATDQSITASDATGMDAERLQGLIQLSAPVVEGDSGGAVANMDGEVVGMTTAASRNGVGAMAQNSPTVAFAIPIEHALEIAHQIENGDESATVHIGEHGLLGVAIQGNTGQGAFVAGVQSGSAAESAGLQEGDTITGLDGHAINGANDLDDAMKTTHVGDHVTVEWQDANGQSHQATVTLEDGAA